ncbi:DUF202 domain-containing protein [Nocardiopsis sediminis]|uniref:DUF202 domain-containing protein n=1 Tax=Nocardiopsis sediminis TaxID=1778267 RepID=A0ABV8FTE2_9ACTN
MSARPDPGLQPERTLLAWQRTLIGVTAVGLLYLRDPLGPWAVPTAPDPMYRLAAVLALVGVAGIVMAHLRRRWRATGHGRHGDDRGRPVAPVARPWALVLLSLGTAGLAAAVAVGALLT